MSQAIVREAISTSRGGAIERDITARESVVDGSVVRRLVPAPGCSMVGPFVSFDHLHSSTPVLPSSAALSINTSTDVAIVTYCLKGALRASAGDASERPTYQSIQSWIALPEAPAAPRPVSEHYATHEIPAIELADTRVCVVLGDAYGQRSPAMHYSPTLKLHCEMPEGAEFQVPTTVTELSIYIVEGLVTIDGRGYTPGMMAVAATGWPARLCAMRDSTVVIIGGEPPRLVRKTHKWAWS